MMPSAGPIPSPPPTPCAQTLDAWESDGCPHDPSLARRRAEALALPLFRQRLLGFLAEVMASQGGHAVPPAPHVDLKSI